MIVGGAASPDEANPAALGLRRAESVRTYLAGQGLAAALIVVESCGSDWARTALSKPTAGVANRRVQVRPMP